MQSRYYNAGLGRFNAPDAFAATGQGILGNNMYAYCGNNSVNSRDTTGKAFEGLSGRGFGQAKIMQAHYGGGYSYITDQNNPTIKDKRFGLATISHGGCGVVASYNALITLGDGKNFDEILSYYNSKILFTIGHGLIGLLYHNIADYFTSLGYTVVVTWSQSEIDEHSKSADACIMYYEFDHTYNFLGFIPIDAYGAHFIEYHQFGDGYCGVNTASNNGVSVFASPSKYGHSGTHYHCVGIFIYR